MGFIKEHKVQVSIFGGLVVIVVALAILFTSLANRTAVINDPVTFQEKYADCDNKINNIIATNALREGYRTDLSRYQDKVSKDYNMTLDDKDAFLTFARKIDDESLKSKSHVLSFYGKVKKQFDLDVAANFFTPEVRNQIDTLFAEYNTAYKDSKYQESYDKLDEISKRLSVRITEEGVVIEEPQQEAAQETKEETPATNETAASTPVSNGRGYHPEATVGQEVVDPNNGNVGVVAQNGIEVYTLPNESTYSYITKEEFIAMLVRSGTREALARQWAEQMANEQGLITIGVDDDGTYE